MHGVPCLCFLRAVITKWRSVPGMFTWKWNSLRRHLWRHIILLASEFDCMQYSHIRPELFIWGSGKSVANGERLLKAAVIGTFAQREDGSEH